MKLPHIEVPGYSYFVTFRTDPGLPPPLSPAEREVVASGIRFIDEWLYDLWNAVVMDDHVHLLLTPRPRPDNVPFPLSHILHSLKSYTAGEINKQRGRGGAVWQPRRHDRAVRSEAEFREKWKYIENNPPKRWPELEVGEYEWVVYGKQISSP